VLPGGTATEPSGIAQHLAPAITEFAGQQCTCPGLIFVADGPNAESFIERLGREVEAAPASPMLAARIRRRYLERLEAVALTSGVRAVVGEAGEIRAAAGRVRDNQPTLEKAVLLRTTAGVFVENETLQEEVFGPAALIVECEDEEDMLRCAGVFQGSLTASIFLSNNDLELAQALTDILSMRVGRLVFNGAPTGVEVGHGTVHGGPFPATNRPDTTAVGPYSLEKWCRPVAFQNAPAALLPDDLRDDNPRGMIRRISGELTREAVPTKRNG
jgi:NADP-dependent aldehyde dehydrogenase